MKLEVFFDKITATLTYVIYDPQSKEAAIIDPVLDYDASTGNITSRSLNKLFVFIEQNNLNPRYVIDTHVHADHITGASYLKSAYPNIIQGIGSGICLVQSVFKDLFNMPSNFAEDGRQFDQLLADGDQLALGALTLEIISTPGHTPACITIKVGSNLFTGDTLFMPDYGTGRCDFPKGSAADQYHSIMGKLYSLPDDTKVYPGHDYMPGGRELRYCTTILEEKQTNIFLKSDTKKEDFVTAREQSDSKKAKPQLLFHSIQVNIDAGVLPAAADNGIRYLKLPLTIV